MTAEILLAAVLALGAGFGLGLFFGRRSTGGKAARQVQDELETYRKDVASHFARTAELVNEMTDSYKAVFDHLQDGAENLMDEQTLRQTLADQSGEVITLQRLGWQRGRTVEQALEAAESEEPSEPEQESAPEPTPDPESEPTADRADTPPMDAVPDDERTAAPEDDDTDSPDENDESEPSKDQKGKS